MKKNFIIGPRKILPILVLLTSVTAFGEIVAETETAVTYRQSDGQEVALPKRPQRVVVAFASLVSVWHAAGGRAVGIPEFRSNTPAPEAMRDLPKIGSGQAPNPEKIMALEPDLVILSGRLERHRSAALLLRKGGVAAVCVEYENYRDFAELLDFFCRLNGHAGAEAAPEARRIDAEVGALCRRAAQAAAPTVGIVFAAARGLSLESPRTNTGMMAAMLGAKNIMNDDSAPRRRFSFERFLLDDPEVVLVILMGEEAALKEKFHREIASQPAWARMKAARHRRVHFLPVEYFLYTPGPRFPAAFRYLAELLYPGVSFAP